MPLVLLFFGIRLLRAPQEGNATNRMVVGTILMTFAATGLVHLSHGIPNPPDGAGGMRAAGGIIGFLASSPLAAAVTSVGAVPLLVLLGFYGLLVLTATPVHQIPHRLHQIANLGRPIATPEEERDLELITFSREQVIRAITTDVMPDEPTDIPSRAIALRVALEEDPPLMLSPAERALLAEWLNRVAK